MDKRRDEASPLYFSGAATYVRMTIARRLTILLALPLLALLALGFFSRIQLGKVEERSRFVAESRIAALATLGNLSRSFQDLRVSIRSLLLATDDAQRGSARIAFDRSDQEVQRLLRLYADKLVFSDQGRRLLGEYQTLSREWTASARQIIELAQAGRREEAVERLNSQITEQGDRLSAVSAEWIQNNEDQATAAGREAVNSIERLRLHMLVANSAAVLLTAILGIVTFRRIVGPIQALESTVKTIAAGDYAREVPFTAATDETGGLARSIDVLKQGAAAMDGQRWVKSNASKLAGELQGAASVEDFGLRLMSGLVPMLGGGVAGFYLFDPQGEELRRGEGQPLDPGAPG